ncbi:hypothetical protein OOK41_21920 [Micromonospora sp. NBC_01655]|uniref:hypothetical protein n=1 Tax=Micromonospora sp. NBC_01655 TaxID=2975983 RepID=UPI00224FE671|nr:hypothetical protein [Micromonospora sp. NBC_01655]MCX4472936.1 hypothetical protein [Micromonospora sp. NBC_01655]
MLPADVDAFSDAVAPSIGGLAQWATHDRESGVVLHDSLSSAVRQAGVQAFLHLLGRDGGVVGPAIQYLHTRVWTTEAEVLEATGGRYRPVTDRPEEMQPGRLAFKWFPAAEADSVHRDFVELVGLAWKALNGVTSPHLVTAAGKPVRNWRIGPAAKAWARRDPGRVMRDGALHLQLKEPGRRGPA